MDASQITLLRQKQNTVFIKNNQTVDSSTMIWKNQLQQSKYIGVPIQTQNCKQITISTGSTQRYPDVYSGASGSASQVYSSDMIVQQKAGRNACGNIGSTEQTITCDYTNTNGPTSSNPIPINNNNNPYLPPFDTYYKFKNITCDRPDKNAKHFVKLCCNQ